MNVFYTFYLYSEKHCIIRGISQFHRLKHIFRYLTVHKSGTFLKQKEGFIISHVTLIATFI